MKGNADHTWANSYWQENFEAGILLADIENDCFKHIWKCHLCQIYADNINQPPVPVDKKLTIPFKLTHLSEIWMNKKTRSCHLPTGVYGVIDHYLKITFLYNLWKINKDKNIYVPSSGLGVQLYIGKVLY